MKIEVVEKRESALLETLLNAWESAVKATHLFLSEQEIAQIKQYVPQALEEIPVLVIAKTEEDAPVAFMGIVDDKLEMLFVDDAQRGKGIGKALLNYGMEHYGVKELGVNEQNPQAKGFYEHMGFEVYKRTPLDEQGNPYPILYMKKSK